MKKTVLSILSLFLLLAGTLTSCEEVTEVGKYDNWRERNEAYCDSLQALIGSNYVATAAQADAMELGKLYAIQVPSSSTDAALQYIYCKKLVSNPEGERPNYLGYHSSVNVFYYGTDITGDKFDGTFEGYSSQDKSIPLPPQKWPTEFDAYVNFAVTGVIDGWTWALQYMRVGERWIVYIPWQSAYGDSDYNTILGYSTLTFDMILDSFAE